MIKRGYVSRQSRNARLKRCRIFPAAWTELSLGLSLIQSFYQP